jgi:hypothetical protein
MRTASTRNGALRLGVVAMGRPESWVPHTPLQKPLYRGDRLHGQCLRSYAA